MFVIGKGNKALVSLPKGKGVRLSILQEQVSDFSLTYCFPYFHQITLNKDSQITGRSAPQHPLGAGQWAWLGFVEEPLCKQACTCTLVMALELEMKFFFLLASLKHWYDQTK